MDLMRKERTLDGKVVSRLVSSQVHGFCLYDAEFQTTKHGYRYDQEICIYGSLGDNFIMEYLLSYHLYLCITMCICLEQREVKL